MKKMIWMATGAAITAAAMFSGVASAEGALTAQLQERISKMSAEQQAALLILLNSGAVGGEAAAPAEAPAAPAAETDPKQALLTGISTILDAAKKEDLDTVMALVSEDFEHPQLGDKAGLREFLQGAIDMGYIEMYADDTEVSTEDTEFEEDGEELIIYPIDVEGPWGSATLEFVAKQEGGAWKIVGVDASGV
ncbi:MAG: hypothetical protein RLZZ303_369 [Candidatus Hydrogenedentota bacterium]|jgi:ketosteroid isomerase-like protein